MQPRASHDGIEMGQVFHDWELHNEDHWSGLDE